MKLVTALVNETPVHLLSKPFMIISEAVHSSATFGAGTKKDERYSHSPSFDKKYVGVQ